MSVRISIGNRIELFEEDLPPKVSEALKEKFVHVNPKHGQASSMGFAETEPPTYRTWKLSTDGVALSLPRGGMQRIRETLKAAGMTWELWKDERIVGTAQPIPDHKRVLYDYQEEAVQAAITRQNCLIRAPTGSGKSTAAIAIISRLKLPSLVMVWSGNLMDQWIRRLVDELGLDESEVGVIRGSDVSLKPVTVAMQQSVVSHLKRGDWLAEKICQSFGVVIADEVQRFAAPTLFASVDPFPAKYRIGISADESRKDGKEFLTYDLFGQVASDIPRDRLIASKHVLDVEIYVVPTGFTANWYRYRQDFNKLLDQMRHSEERNNLITSLAVEEMQKGQQVLVLSHRVEHCREIDQTLSSMGFRSGVLLGNKAYEEIFSETRKGLEDGSYRAAVGTIQAVGQGLDIPALSRGILATPVASNRQQFNQIRGRICRAGKKDAKLYYLWDEAIYGKKAIENLVSWNNVVKIFWDGEWIDAEEYLRHRRPRRTANAKA